MFCGGYLVHNQSYFQRQTILNWGENKLDWWYVITAQERYSDYSPATAQINNMNNTYYWVALG